MIWLLAVPIYYAIYTVHAVITLLFFLAIMRLQEIRDAGKLTKPLAIVGYLLFGIGWFVDFTFNLNSSVAMFDFPREWLFSAKASRLSKQAGIKGAINRWACKNFLNPGDPSDCHCK